MMTYTFNPSKGVRGQVTSVRLRPACFTDGVLSQPELQSKTLYLKQNKTATKTTNAIAS